MRDAAERPVVPASQGLTMQLKYKQNLKLREVPERKQVGDAESMINEGVSGFFKEEGQV